MNRRKGGSRPNRANHSDPPPEDSGTERIRLARPVVLIPLQELAYPPPLHSLSTPSNLLSSRLVSSRLVSSARFNHFFPFFLLPSFPISFLPFLTHASPERLLLLSGSSLVSRSCHSFWGLFCCLFGGLGTPPHSLVIYYMLYTYNSFVQHPRTSSDLQGARQARSD
jgi:hypothetical protein